MPGTHSGIETGIPLVVDDKTDTYNDEEIDEELQAIIRLLVETRNCAINPRFKEELHNALLEQFRAKCITGCS